MAHQIVRFTSLFFFLSLILLILSSNEICLSCPQLLLIFTHTRILFDITFSYAPWCGHCKSLAPKFVEAEELTSQDDGVTTNFAEVDCAHDKSKKTCKRFDVRGFPTLVFLSHGNLVEYEGKRETDDLVKFASADWDSEPFGAWIHEAEEHHKIMIDGIPEELTAWKEFMNGLIKDMNELYQLKKNAIVVTLVVGFLFGWLCKGMCTSSVVIKVHSE